jgi:hypothetical protein
MKLLLGIALLAVFQNSEQSKVDRSVFGIPLGAKFSIPECPKQMFGKKQSATISYTYPYSTVCFERISPSPEKLDTPIINDTVYIRFPIDRRPSLVPTGTLVGGVVAGNLESIGFNTSGYSIQDVVLDELKKKYGEDRLLLK